MFFRAVIFLILVFLLYRVLKSFQRWRLARNTEAKVSVPPIAGGDLVEDPVCHRHVPMNQSYKKEISGKTYYFCGKDCLEKYTTENEI